MDDFGCGTSPAGHSAVVLAPGRGFGYPGTDRSAWPGHIGRHGAVAGRRAGVGGAVHSGRQASGRAWPTHGAGPSGECLGRWAGFRGRWAGLQRRWQHFFFLGGLLTTTFSPFVSELPYNGLRRVSCASIQGPGRRSDAIGSTGVSACTPSLRTSIMAVPGAPSSAYLRTSARRAATCSPLRTRRTRSRHPISWVRIGAQYDDRPAPAAHDRRSCCSIPSLSPRRQMLQLCPGQRFLRHVGRGHAQFRRRWTRQERQ